VICPEASRAQNNIAAVSAEGQDGFVDKATRDGYETGWTGPGGSFEKLTGILAGERLS
jgi:hypothetical protein